MKLTELLKELNIGKWSACWAFISDGWAGIARLVCEAFTKLLRRKDPDKLRNYAEFVGKVAAYTAAGASTDTSIRQSRMRSTARTTPSSSL